MRKFISWNIDSLNAALTSDSPRAQLSRDVLNTYYLWTSEIAGDLPRLDPDTCLDPVGVVREIRYHAAGREVDHWTVLTDDFDSFTSSMQGLGLTYGYELQSGRISNREGQYFLVVTCVYPGGPAQKAGLKRGDIIVTIDGKPVTRDNLYDALDSRSVILGVTFLDGDGTISSWHQGALSQLSPITVG